ncbi:hypothetical protein [Actinoallomurus sp. NPDC052274]|uniref:hypothetical protein n=1 Tax=Actinoallomurus sp. NPDC052274 TaxID=3155420 RepID=UPI003448803D
MHKARERGAPTARADGEEGLRHMDESRFQPGTRRRRPDHCPLLEEDLGGAA